MNLIHKEDLVSRQANNRGENFPVFSDCVWVIANMGS
jgi:hypothetical protein